MGLEGADGEMIERGRENDARNLFFGQPVQDVETRSIAHLDVEQHDIGLQFGDLRDGLAATVRRTHMINLGKLRENQFEPPQRERLIVDGQDLYRHPAYPSGNSSVARKPEAEAPPVDNFAAAPKQIGKASGRE